MYRGSNSGLADIAPASHARPNVSVKLRSLLEALLVAGSVVSSGVITPGLGAQVTRKDSTQENRGWITKRDAVGAALAVLGTLALTPVDARAARELQERQFQRSDDLQHTARDLAFLGGPAPFILGAGLLAAGRVARLPPLADAGIHVTEAVLLAASVTGLGKGIFGRALPQVNVNNPDDFQFFRGFHDGNGPFVSFPSGHAAASFAMAAAVTAEVDRWHPEMTRFVGPVAYGAAGLVGLARMYQNVHWASDLPLAAAIGTWSGLTVVGRSHRSSTSSPSTTDNLPAALARIVRSTTVVPVAGGGRGAGLGWSIPLELGSRSHGQ